MGESLRREVLKVFKQLHKTRKHIFQGDDRALQIVRTKINEEYKKHFKLTDKTTISELNKYAKEVEHELRTTVVRAVEKKPGIYEIQITEDTKLVDNMELVQPCQQNTKQKGLKTKK